MFRIFMNGTLMETVRGYNRALEKAEKIKKLFCKSGQVVVEDEKGFPVGRF